MQYLRQLVGMLLTYLDTYHGQVVRTRLLIIAYQFLIPVGCPRIPEHIPVVVNIEYLDTYRGESPYIRPGRYYILWCTPIREPTYPLRSWAYYSRGLHTRLYPSIVW